MQENEVKNLIAQAQNGDEKSFGLLYEQYFEKIFKFIFFRVNHKEIAEDLTEEVFVKAWTKIKHVKGESFGGWLFQIAKNQVIDHYRKNKTTVDLSEVESILVAEHNLVDETNLLLDQKIFLEQLKKLTPEQQIVIQLKFIEDLDNTEIAELISKSEGSIRVIQHRAIQKLQQLIEEKISPTEKIPSNILENKANVKHEI